MNVETNMYGLECVCEILPVGSVDGLKVEDVHEFGCDGFSEKVLDGKNHH